MIFPEAALPIRSGWLYSGFIALIEFIAGARVAFNHRTSKDVKHDAEIGPYSNNGRCSECRISYVELIRFRLGYLS